jgi:hypothetical protein
MHWDSKRGIHPPNLRKGALRGAEPLFILSSPPRLVGGDTGGEVTMIALPPIDWYNMPYRDRLELVKALVVTKHIVLPKGRIDLSNGQC